MKVKSAINKMMLLLKLEKQEEKKKKTCEEKLFNIHQNSV